jgi:beta-fructofuranosidase
MPFSQPSLPSSYPYSSITMAALVNILSVNTKRQAGGLDYNSAPPNLSTLGNNTLFDTWRPRAHVLPPSNHIGDPCSELRLPRP